MKMFAMQPWVFLCALTILLAPKVEAQQPAHEPIGYFLGLSMGQQMSQNGFRAGDFELEALLAGFRDGLEKKEAVLTNDQLREAQMKIQTLIQQRQLEMQQVLAEQGKAAKAKGEAFLAANAKKEGVKTLPSGVQYQVLTAGRGDTPTATDTVKVHYTGKLINGTKFDSSVDRGEPATFRVNQVIQGWQIALQQMKVGDKWMLYIPSDLAYGERGGPGGGIGPNEVLIFEVELLDIQ